MNERQTDFELLRNFVRRADQTAFANVVRRHLDLVYATALRKAEDDGAAQEISQNVFAALARKAWQFAPDDSLPAWLYKTTLLEAREWLRGELRRRRREQTAAELGTTMKTPDEQTALRALVPLLDEALLSLREKDRTALLLRFYERQSLRGVGASLGIGEDAAQKRVGGALEKLTRFFQRRGFKTASVAAATAALQHTAAAAPAAVSTAVAQAALQFAPPSLGGLAWLLSRIAGLSKTQTAVLCVVLAVAPVAWQWNEQRQADAEAALSAKQLAAIRSDQITLRSEIERLQASVARLTDSATAAAAVTARNAEAAQQFAGWKNRIRGLLFAADYHWPDDSPFVRIPKSALKHFEVDRPISPPGEVKTAARELLGLAPEERERLEDVLHRHFAAVDRLIDERSYETNRSDRLTFPPSAARKIFVVPPLGSEATSLADQLKEGLKNIVGEERWPLVEAPLKNIGTDSLRRVLNLDSGSQAQEVAVWVAELEPGKPVAGFEWAGQQSMFTTAGVNLNAFLAGNDFAGTPEIVEQYRRFDFPEAVSRQMLDWLGQEAARRLGKEVKQ